MLSSCLNLILLFQFPINNSELDVIIYHPSQRVMENALKGFQEIESRNYVTKQKLNFVTSVSNGVLKSATLLLLMYVIKWQKGNGNIAAATNYCMKMYRGRESISPRISDLGK